MDPSTGRRLGPNSTGELCVHSPFLMRGYLNRVEETREYFDEEGFGRVGDAVYYDEQGTLFYVERLKMMIK